VECDACNNLTGSVNQSIDTIRGNVVRYIVCRAVADDLLPPLAVQRVAFCRSSSPTMFGDFRVRVSLRHVPLLHFTTRRYLRSRSHLPTASSLPSPRLFQSSAIYYNSLPRYDRYSRRIETNDALAPLYALRCRFVRVSCARHRLLVAFRPATHCSAHRDTFGL